MLFETVEASCFGYEYWPCLQPEPSVVPVPIPAANESPKAVYPFLMGLAPAAVTLEEEDDDEEAADVVDVAEAEVFFAVLDACFVALEVSALFSKKSKGEAWVETSRIAVRNPKRAFLKIILAECSRLS